LDQDLSSVRYKSVETCESSSFEENVIELPLLLHQILDCNDSLVSEINYSFPLGTDFTVQHRHPFLRSSHSS